MPSHDYQVRTAHVRKALRNVPYCQKMTKRIVAEGHERDVVTVGDIERLCHLENDPGPHPDAKLVLMKLRSAGLLAKLEGDGAVYRFQWPEARTKKKNKAKRLASEQPKAITASKKKRSSLPAGASKHSTRVSPGIIAEIAELDPHIWWGNHGWLLDHPDSYLVHRDALHALSRWLKECRRDCVEVSEQDRAYEIWGDEHAFNKSGGKSKIERLLDHVGITRTDLKILPGGTTGFLSFVRPDAPQGSKILMSENSCTYNALCRLLAAHSTVDVFGVAISGAIFAEGGGMLGSSKGDKRRGSLMHQTFNQLGVAPNDVLYLGDIDPAGICLMEHARRVFNIKPHVGAYAAMCRLHSFRREHDGPECVYCDIQTHPTDIEAFYALLPPDAAKEACRVIDAGARIPQEILTTPLVRAATQGSVVQKKRSLFSWLFTVGLLRLGKSARALWFSVLAEKAKVVSNCLGWTTRGAGCIARLTRGVHGDREVLLT